MLSSNIEDKAKRSADLVPLGVMGPKNKLFFGGGRGVALILKPVKVNIKYMYVLETCVGSK